MNNVLPKKILFTIFFLVLTKWIFSTPDTLKILTWNIYMLPRQIMYTHQLQRADSIVKRLHEQNPDIIILQEVFDQKAKNILVKGLQKNYPYYVGPGYKRLFKLSSGVMVFSKFEIDCEDMVHYKDCKAVDCWAKKGGLFADIKLKNNQSIHIIGTHMQSKKGWLYDQIRNKQLKLIKSLAEVNKQTDVPIIFAGDFNISPEDSLHNDMYKKLQAIKYELNGDRIHSLTEENDWRVKSGEKGNDLLDYILLNPNNTSAYIQQLEIIRFTAQLKKNRKDLSDHFAVMCTLIF